MGTVILNDGRAIEYQRCVKRVKNINVRIKNDGCVYVSASKSVPVKVIEDFILQKAEPILRAKEKYGNQASPLYCDGDTITILGKERVLRVSEGARSCVTLTDTAVELSLCDTSDVKEKRALLEKLRLSVCREAIPPLVDRIYLSYFKGMGAKAPTLKYRRMTSRWGSCHTSKGVVTFSTALACVDEGCIELVVAHELSHLLQADHSKRFYAILGTVIPDHKQRKKRLTSYNARL